MAVRTVNPFKCRMWEMHDRLSENIDCKSCASLIDSIRKHGQRHAVLARVSDGPDNFEYELIYGARRLFVAQHLGVDLLIDVREFDNRSGLIEMDCKVRQVGMRPILRLRRSAGIARAGRGLRERAHLSDLSPRTERIRLHDFECNRKIVRILFASHPSFRACSE